MLVFILLTSVMPISNVYFCLPPRPLPNCMYINTNQECMESKQFMQMSEHYRSYTCYNACIS